MDLIGYRGNVDHLETELQEMGAGIEKFLSQECTKVITNRREVCQANDLNK